MTELGRVADPRALDTVGGPRGRLKVVVPEAWARPGRQIDVVAPKRIECALCRGGGCDRCERSGAIKLCEEPSHRTLTLSLPPLSDGVVLRIPKPFAACELELLEVELSLGDQASDGCSPARAGGLGAAAGWVPWAAAAVALIALISLAAQGC